MPSADGENCVPRLDHCEDEPMETQPGNLGQDDGRWVCNVCEWGYYFDGEICVECTMDGCENCAGEDLCLNCEDGLLLQPNGLECIPPFDDCIIPPSQQEERLSVNADGYYYCGECANDQYFDENLERCRDCSKLDEDCEMCTDARTCTKCDGNQIPNGSRCNDPRINWCRTINEDNGKVCDQCIHGYSLNNDATKCVNCDAVT